MVAHHKMVVHFSDREKQIQLMRFVALTSVAAISESGAGVSSSMESKSNPPESRLAIFSYESKFE